uniref:Tetraspanin-10 n=1 Tax=Oryza meridionalis TaxID=40149 RepID=A0A0E0EZN0_9ORYZ
MGSSTSAFVIRWINFFTMILALLVVGFGFWMSTHNDECRRSLTIPVMGLGGVIFLISLVGFLGAWKKIACLLWTVYYHKYRNWPFCLWGELNDTEKWTHLRSCLVKSDDCNGLSRRYKTLKQYKLADLTPMESGCCRPPAECGYPAVNASYFDLSYHPVSTNVDCKLYKNARSVLCYDCDSCKAGVAQYMKAEWRVVAIFNVILFVILSFVYFVACCARRNTGERDSKYLSHALEVPSVYIAAPLGQIFINSGTDDCGADTCGDVPDTAFVMVMC